MSDPGAAWAYLLSSKKKPRRCGAPAAAALCGPSGREHSYGAVQGDCERGHGRACGSAEHPGLKRGAFLIRFFPHIFVWGSYSLTHALAHSLSLTHSLTFTQLTLTHSHSLTHTQSLTLTHTHSHSLTHTQSLTLTHTHSHSLTLTHSLTHAHSLSFTHSHSLTHSLIRSLTHSHSLTHGSCLEGQDVVARAAGGVRNRGRRSTLAMPLRKRGRRSTLAMPLPKSWQAQHSVHLGVCLCGRGRVRQLSRGTGCCRARGGGCAKSWQAQHFGDAVAKTWQAQRFGDAVAEVVAGAAFCASGCVFVWQGSRSAAV